MTTNELGFAKLQEDQRHNRVSEIETERNNRAVVAETNRSNLAREVETHRSNVVNENEAMRANLARETETHRHNVNVETETERSNRMTENWRDRSLNETIRSNLASESLRAQANAIQARSVTENARHNAASEKLISQQNAINANRSLLDYTIQSRNLDSQEILRGYQGQQAVTQANLNTAKTITEGYYPSQIAAQRENTQSQTELNRAQTNKINSLTNSEIFSNYAGGVAGVLRAGSSLIH